MSPCFASRRQTYRRRTRLAALLVVVSTAAVKAQPVPAGVEELVDVAALARRVGDARLVAIGESAHGSRGYAELQRQLMQRLIEHHGHRTVMMELVSDHRALNEAVARCDEVALRRALYRNPWNDNHASRFEFYRWLCDFNRRHPEAPVEVVAIDAQKPWLDVWVLSRWYEALAPKTRERLVGPVTTYCFGAKNTDQIDWAKSPECAAHLKTKRLNPSAHAKCLQALSAVKRDVQQHRAGWAADAGVMAVGDVETALASLTAWETHADLMFTAPEKSLRVREDGMARNILWRFTSRGRPKSLLVAHNMHVAKTPVPVAAQDPEGWNGLNAVGAQLRAALGADYVAVGLTGYRVSSMFDRVFPLPEAADSLDLMLVRARPQTALSPLWVDTAAAPWLANQRLALHNEEEPNGRRYRVATAFDALVFLPASEAAVRLGDPDRDGGVR